MFIQPNFPPNLFADLPHGLGANQKNPPKAYPVTLRRPVFLREVVAGRKRPQDVICSPMRLRYFLGHDAPPGQSRWLAWLLRLQDREPLPEVPARISPRPRSSSRVPGIGTPFAELYQKFVRWHEKRIVLQDPSDDHHRMG